MDRAYKQLVAEQMAGGTWSHPVYSRFPRGGANVKGFFRKIKNIGKDIGNSLKKKGMAVALDAGKAVLLEQQSPTKAIFQSLNKRKGNIGKALVSGVGNIFKKKKGAGGRVTGGRIGRPKKSKSSAAKKKKSPAKKRTSKKRGGGFKNRAQGHNSAPRTKKLVLIN